MLQEIPELTKEFPGRMLPFVPGTVPHTRDKIIYIRQINELMLWREEQRGWRGDGSDWPLHCSLYKLHNSTPLRTSQIPTELLVFLQPQPLSMYNGRYKQTD